MQEPDQNFIKKLQSSTNGFKVAHHTQLTLPIQRLGTFTLRFISTFEQYWPTGDTLAAIAYKRQQASVRTPKQSLKQPTVTKSENGRDPDEYTFSVYGSSCVDDDVRDDCTNPITRFSQFFYEKLTFEIICLSRFHLIFYNSMF